MIQPTHRVPPIGAGLWLTDGGLETTLIFHDGVELRDFAAFELLTHAKGRALLDRYFRRYAEVAAEHGTGFLLESPTWRASARWGERLGYDGPALRDVNRQAMAFLREVGDRYASAATPVAVSGCMGPRADGYVADTGMTPEEAEAYHRPQVDALLDGGADLVSAFTMNYTAEAIGLARAAGAAGVPVVISFTVETDGRLPSGRALRDAILEVDAATDPIPTYYMVNCAHPTHFDHVLESDAAWRERIGGVRANASTLSHAELDEAEELDAGDPAALAADYRRLHELLPNLTVMGGCCGTDHTHVAAIARAVSGR